MTILHSLMRTESEILSEIDCFAPTAGDWRPMDVLLGDLWSLGVREDHLPILFRVFERFPSEDGAGVLWGIVHGVEALPFDYEPALLASIDRKTSHLGELMLERLQRSRSDR